MMTKSRTVLLWGGDDLLSSSIEIFLASQAGWKVISFSEKDGFEVLEKALESTGSEIVILRAADEAKSEGLSMRLLQDHPALKVINVGFENSCLEVYTRQRVKVSQASDLISILEYEP